MKKTCIIMNPTNQLLAFGLYTALYCIGVLKVGFWIPT